MKLKTFSFIEREDIFNGLEDKEYDVIVIGGGITGVGIALDCTTRGLKTLLIEMQDFAAGTSSRSTKLVHGGLRYLKQLEIGMVAEVGKEREVVYTNAPHVTSPEWMLLPIYKKGTFGRYSTSLGLYVYDYLAGVKRSEKRKMLSSKNTLDKEPLLSKENLLGGGYYVEYRTDDARLTIEVAKKAWELGAHLLNYTKVEAFLYDPRREITGVNIKNVLTGVERKVYAKKIVNATGPWVESVISLDEKIKNKSLYLTKGVHIVIDKSKFPLQQSIYFDAPDGRMIFAIPRGGKAYIGTTDTEYTGDLQNPLVTLEDKEYLLKCIKVLFPTINVNLKDIESTWAGVRPLIRQEGKGPSEVSRKDEVWTSETGLVTIAGGKLTGYRKMAETVTDMISKDLVNEGFEFKKSMTKDLRLSGGEFATVRDYKYFILEKTKVFTDLGLSVHEATNILSVYGTNALTLANLVVKVMDYTDLPLSIKLMIHYAIDYEMALTPVDFFMRRTGTIFFDIEWVVKWEDSVIQYMANIMNWDHHYSSLLREELHTRMLEARS